VTFGAILAGAAVAVIAMNASAEEVVAVEAPTVAGLGSPMQNGSTASGSEQDSSFRGGPVEAAVVGPDEPTEAPAIEPRLLLLFEDGHIRVPVTRSLVSVAPEATTVTEVAAPAVAAPDAAPQATGVASAELVPVEVHAAEVPDPPAPDSSTGSEVVLVPKPYDPWLPVRRCESSNNYAVNTGNGFYGAYQFTISTWNWVAGLIGRDDLVGVRPDRAAPADQDRLAQALAFEVRGGGLGHWPVCGRYYGT
jgi:hypothetical protein